MPPCPLGVDVGGLSSSHNSSCYPGAEGRGAATIKSPALSSCGQMEFKQHLKGGSGQSGTPAAPPPPHPPEEVHLVKNDSHPSPGWLPAAAWNTPREAVKSLAAKSTPPPHAGGHPHLLWILRLRD